MERYNFKTIEDKWQSYWEKNNSFKSSIDKNKKSFSLFLRQPYWSKGLVIKQNKKIIQTTAQKGYIKIAVPTDLRTTINIDLGMGINLVSSHPKVRQNNGKLAVQRGPIIYCMEETDNGKHLHNIALIEKVLKPSPTNMKSYKYVSIKGKGQFNSLNDWNNKLYSSNVIKKIERKNIKMIPYFLWANRRVGEMRVWFNSI